MSPNTLKRQPFHFSRCQVGGPTCWILTIQCSLWKPGQARDKDVGSHFYSDRQSSYSSSTVNNENVTLIASSPETKFQIFKYKNHAYGIQFHIEIKKTTVGEWACVPEYKSALEKELGEGALEKFDADAKNNMSNMNNYSKILYENFKKLLI